MRAASIILLTVTLMLLTCFTVNAEESYQLRLLTSTYMNVGTSDNYLKISVVNPGGIFDGGMANITVGDNYGHVEFVNLNDVNVTFTPSINGSDVYINSVRVPPGSIVCLRGGQYLYVTWQLAIQVEPPVMLYVGLGGACMLLFAPLWAIKKVREGKWEWLLYAFVLCIFGFCLVVGWLWS